jgi:hemerythrin-like domain-containing protein
MRPTQKLTEEHKSIKEGLRVLEKIYQRLESGERVDPEHIEKMIEFIRGFSDKCHHFKEEDQLFVEMEKAGIPREGGPLGVMLAEHDMGRGYVRGMSEAVVNYKMGDGGVTPVIIDNAKNFVSLLTGHIDKEDNILFPMADAHLSEEKQRALEVEFERIDRETIGTDKIAEFHSILNRLKDIYLK